MNSIKPDMNNIEHNVPLQPLGKGDIDSDKTLEESDVQYVEISELNNKTSHPCSKKHEYSQSVGFIEIEHSYGYIPISIFPDKRIVFFHRKTEQMIMIDLEKKTIQELDHNYNPISPVLKINFKNEYESYLYDSGKNNYRAWYGPQCCCLIL